MNVRPFVGACVRVAVGAALLAAAGGIGLAGEPPKPSPDAVQRAIDELAAPAPETRTAAAGRLAAGWPAAARAAPYLSIALRDEDPRVRDAAFAAIRALAERAVPVVAANLKSLGAEDPGLAVLRALGAAVTPTDVAMAVKHGGTFRGRRSPGAVPGGLTLLAALPVPVAYTGEDPIRLANHGLAGALAGAEDSGSSHPDQASASLVVRALEVAHLRGFREPVSLSSEVRRGLLADARSKEPVIFISALQLIHLSRAGGEEATAAALDALTGDSRTSALLIAVALVSEAAAKSPRIAELLETSRDVGPAVPILEEAGSWPALALLLRNPNFGPRTAAARSLLAAGRGGKEAARALTMGLDSLFVPELGEESPFDAKDGRLRTVVAAVGKVDEMYLRRLEAHLRRLQAPRRLALADALAHATPPSAEGARLVAEALQAEKASRDPSVRPQEQAYWPMDKALADSFLWISDGEQALALARTRLRDPAVDVEGICHACTVLSRLGAPAAEAAPDLVFALTRVLSRPAGDVAFPPSGPPTFARLLEFGAKMDARLEACDALLDVLGALGPVAKSAASTVEAAGDGAPDPRISHLAARAVRRISAK